MVDSGGPCVQKRYEQHHLLLKVLDLVGVRFVLEASENLLLNATECQTHSKELMHQIVGMWV